MNREIKFRAWQDNQMLTSPISSNYGLTRFFGFLYEDTPIMQYTGLKDKNGKGSVCLYEGDILSLTGELIGNIYENSELLKDKTNIIIERLGTKAWGYSEKKAMDRGWGYPI